MQSILKTYVSKLLCFSLCFSIACPLKAQSISPVLEKEFKRDSTEKVKLIANAYNKARIEFEKKGAKAFVDQLQVSAPNAFTQSERNFLAKKVAREQMLPVLVVKGDTLFGYEGKKEIFALNTYDVIQGNFKLPKQKLIYNHDKRLIENYESWTSKKSKFFSASTVFEKFIFNVESFFIPQAEAFTPMMGALIFGLIGGLAGFFFGKFLAHKKAKKEAEAAAIAQAQAQYNQPTHAAPAPIANANSNTTTPNTNVELPDANNQPASEEPAAEGGDAAAGEGTVDAGTAATTTGPAAGTTTTVKPIDPEALAYIKAHAQNPYELVVADEESFRKLQAENSYVTFVDTMLHKLKVDLETNKIEKAKARTVLKTLVTGKDGHPIHTLLSIESSIGYIDEKTK